MIKKTVWKDYYNSHPAIINGTAKQCEERIEDVIPVIKSHCIDKPKQNKQDYRAFIFLIYGGHGL